MSDKFHNTLFAHESIIKKITSTGSIDFNTIVPTPDLEENTFGIGFPEDAINVAKQIYHKDRHTTKHIVEDINRLDERSIHELLTLICNYKSTGYINTTEFQYAEWGCKGNAINSSVKANIATFYTINGCPGRVIKRLSEMFPNDAISLFHTSEEKNIGQLVTYLGGGETKSIKCITDKKLIRQFVKGSQLVFDNMVVP